METFSITYNYLWNSKKLSVKLLVQIGLRILILIMLLKALMVPVVYIDFKLNQDYIAKVLCINRDKPELQCNGHCILMEKIKKTQEATQSQEDQTNHKQLLEVFCENLFDFRPIPFFLEKESQIPNDRSFPSSYHSVLFHPPKTIV